MEAMVHSDEVEKNAIAYKGHEVDGEERNPNQDVELLQSWVPHQKTETHFHILSKAPFDQKHRMSRQPFPKYQVNCGYPHPKQFTIWT